MPTYFNPYTDFGFKKLFGEDANKDILMDFLNSILPSKHQIKTLNFRNTEQLGPLPVNRRAVFDIFCESKKGEKFIVEMQKSVQHYFKDRALFYAAYPIREQAPKGAKSGEEWDYNLDAVYFVGILNFKYEAETEKALFMRDVSLRDKFGNEFFDKLHFYFFQMPLFKKRENELKTHADKWLYFLKHLTSFDHIPSIFGEKVFKKAFHTAELGQLSSEELFNYEHSLKILRDNYAVDKTMFDLGKSEGKSERDKEIARSMLADGISIKTITKHTGLSPKEIEKLTK
ncbi:MAG: Rpn family recombination-promoting nuclease/putative transposase [Planctomycetaceae bacterium]|jgi:predicted transposase/invertase (TIGR01784 family)|nr:Rpn family recombination-promoting nuclease/putative transposase [Planctomycetaceae bacterium]